MKIISYSAPAKVILSGEHAVVYGKPALVSAIDLLLRFTVTNSARLPATLSLARRAGSSKDGDTSKVILLITQKVKEFLHKQKIKFEDRKYTFYIDSKIPISRGLGSSAALSVAATAALLEFYTGKKFDKETINNVAYQAEKYFHKNPSGIDNTASCFGGLIYYRKEFEFLKNISTLNFKISKNFEDKLFLIDSGKSVESTAEMIHIVGKKYNEKPQFIEEVFNDIEKVTKRIVVSLIKEDEEFFMKSIIDNEVLLEMLGIVSTKTKGKLKELEQFGFGKVTGAGGLKGGSGFLLFYSKKQKNLQEFCEKKKITFMKFKQSFEGVKKEQ